MNIGMNYEYWYVLVQNYTIVSATFTQVLNNILLYVSFCTRLFMLAACLAYRDNMLFKYIWGLRDIQRQISFHNFKCGYNAELLNLYILQ